MRTGEEGSSRASSGFNSGVPEAIIIKDLALRFSVV
jgi:hypothetical protein